MGRRSVLTRRIRLLVAVTIAYNVVEAVIALSAGAAADSTALIGFGLDSVVEVSSAAAIAWQFSARDPARREQVTLRIIAVSFFALATYVTVESVRTLISGVDAGPSTVGVILAAVSLAVMPGLSYAQRRAGRELGSRTAVADSEQTLLCTYLSAVLLIGLGLNSLFGWSWADPVAGLVIAVVALKEGRDTWRGDACCAPAVHAETADTCCATTPGRHEAATTSPATSSTSPAPGPPGVSLPTPLRITGGRPAPEMLVLGRTASSGCSDGCCADKSGAIPALGEVR